jgi:hypothetical protein
MKKKLIKKGLIAMVILVLVGLPVYSGGVS